MFPSACKSTAPPSAGTHVALGLPGDSFYCALPCDFFAWLLEGLSLLLALIILERILLLSALLLPSMFSLVHCNCFVLTWFIF